LITTLEKEITFRYLKTRKKDGFLNIISIFSFIGISLGVAVLIIVMSVMNGFRTELINKIVGFNPHATLEFYGGKNDLKTLKNSKIKNKIKNTIISNYSEGIILTRSNDSNNYQNKTKGIMLRGYLLDQFRNLSIINNEDYFGKKKLLQDSISIGEELSINLNLNIGDKVAIMSPTGIQTIIGSLPKQKIFTVTSIYKSGLADFDNNIAFINLNTLEDLFDVDKKNRKLEIYFFEPKEIENLKIELVKLFEMNNIYTWSDMNSSLFSALKVERNVMFIILSLIIIVAAFNIISGLTILVKNKTRDIAILKSIGVLNKSIVKIFFFVGVIIGTSATFFGIILGVLFSLYVENIREFLSNTFNIGLFPEEIYFLSKMPSEINFTSIFIISFSSILITTIVSIFPAIKAARLDTVKALKYE
tara:strand:- start:722 stop:1975 length:1254 start_codon:yes stop_codon:yes gene_type:complete